MTVQELFTQALALLDETTQERYTSEFKRVLIPQVNLVLADTWWLHNRMQRVEDGDQIPEIPAVTSDLETLPYRDEINRDVLPYGLAARLILEDNPSKGQYFDAVYDRQKQKYRASRREPIREVRI